MLSFVLAAAAAVSPVPVPAAAAILPVPLQPIVPAAQRTCTAKTASGLGYSVLKAAEGPTAGPTDYVLINYIGYLAADGQVFDQAATTPMTVDGVIPGFGEGLKMIPRGGVYRFCVPAALGYGAEASGPIPANSELVFQVELLDSRTAAEVEAMRQAAAQPAAAEAPAKP
jgi:FKBP-type peptidyl-prolyl cis-trans isomerase FkpA